MAKALIEEAVDLRELDVDFYQSKNLWRPTGARGVFGGQVVGQSLMAATRTIPPETFSVHSLHSYFLLPGDPAKPILYQVDRVRDGKSYCTRTVHALQNGKIIFICQVSFHLTESTPLEHQYPMPQVTSPDNLPSQDELVKRILEDPATTPTIGNSIRFHIFEPFDLEIRFLEEVSVKTIMAPQKLEARQAFWIRVGHRLPDDLRLHQCIAAYATDHLLLSTALRPYGLHMWNPQVTFMATIDHCIWFHSPFRVDEWLLYEMESPRATSGRGFSLGRLYNQSGTLVLSCAQEGAIRIRGSAKSKL